MGRCAAVAVATGGKMKVAVIQDQQIPKDVAVGILEEKGMDVAWSLTEPSDATAIVTVTNPVTVEVLDKHPNCKLVAVSFTGFNHVALEASPAYNLDACPTPPPSQGW